MLADGGGDLGGEGDSDSRLLDAVVERAGAADVGAVGEDSPRVVFEAVPLLREVVADVIADLGDQLAESHRDLVQVRGEDDQLAAVGHDRFELVHALAGDPQLVIHRRSTAQHRVK